MSALLHNGVPFINQLQTEMNEKFNKQQQQISILQDQTEKLQAIIEKMMMVIFQIYENKNVVDPNNFISPSSNINIHGNMDKATSNNQLDTVLLDQPELNHYFSHKNAVNKQLCNKESVESCCHFERLKTTLEKHENEHYMENGKQTLDDFIHLMHHHDTDQEFDFVVKSIGYCEISNCRAFTRNIRKNDNSVEEQKNEIDPIHIAHRQILDKIHCHYKHCYDIGNRLSLNETPKNGGLLDKPVFNEIINAKNKNNMTMNQYQHKKYNQLQFDDTESEIYSFGYKFSYGYPAEIYDSKDSDVIEVKQKYSSLKEELISNTISQLSMEQFNAEYEKANMHYNTDHCIQTFRKTNTFYLDYLLSLMVYCNWTELQYSFSKTYRENDGKDHHNFYHFGKSIKIAIHTFGTAIKDGKIATFFHGVGQQLIFPKYVDSMGVSVAYHGAFDIDGLGADIDTIGGELKEVIVSCGVSIQCPLSTSSSKAVALNFTNNNNGLIIEFTGDSTGNAKYFSCGWISDYGNESEYLFVQNQERLNIDNIIHIISGYEYKPILIALKVIDRATKGLLTGDNVCVTASTAKLIISIIHHKLSSSFPTYKPCDFLDKYGENMINAYFAHKKKVRISYRQLNIFENSCLLDTFFDSKPKRIKMKEITVLFANLKGICIADIQLSRDIILHIIDDLKRLDPQCKLQNITIHNISKKSSLSASSAMKYQQEFETMNYTLLSPNEGTLCIDTQLQDFDGLDEYLWGHAPSSSAPSISTSQFTTIGGELSVTYTSSRIEHQNEDKLYDLYQGNNNNVISKALFMYDAKNTSICVTSQDQHKYNESNSLKMDSKLKIEAAHTLQLNLTNISISNENYNIPTPTPSTPDTQNNINMSGYPKKASDQQVGTNDLNRLNGVKSAPIRYNADKLTNNNRNFTKTAIKDAAIIGINHSYMARKIWLNSCLQENNSIAHLSDLYPSLMDEFKRLTKCDRRQPTLQQIELFFVRIGGEYDMNNISLAYITADKFDKFFAWFRSMCSIIKDLRPMYNRDEDPLIGLFYGRTTAQESLEHKPEGTFILRLASQQNGLAITYKNPHGKIQNVLLTRISNEMYRVGTSNKETLLFQLIKPWPKLKYLYTPTPMSPNKLIPKKLLF